MRLFFGAGEASGDAYAGALLRELGGQAEGMGGPHLRAAGAHLIADSSAWGAISISESFKVGVRVLFGYLRVRRALLSGEPGLFVPIDYGFINLRLARAAKARGWKVLYFVPPGSWRRDRQGRDLPLVADEIVTPFSWSAEILNQMGAKAHWFGHPLVDLTPRLGEEKTGFAFFPGSRKHELSEHLPVLARSELPQAQFGIAPNVGVAAIETPWRRLAPNRSDTFRLGETAAVLNAARTAVVCSGTVTLQAAITHTPMVVIYRFPKLAEWEGRLLGVRKKIKFISLPNILLDRAAVPELIQEEVTPENVRRHALALHAEGEARERQLAAFRDLDEVLGPPGAIRRTAELMRTMLGR